MKINLTLLAMLFACHFSFANDPIQISILTCSPGEEIYSVFGHSSVRVVDREKGSDLVYNFGIFDFDTPNFAYKFVKGKLKYQLGIQQIENFIRIYTSEGRWVTEQVLDLSETQERAIIDRLEYLYRPENRYYYYSFLEKDCSTELRDLLSFAGVDFSSEQLPVTSRDLINSYLEEKKWIRLGVNMIMGKVVDESFNRYQSMFLPDYLKQEVDSATTSGRSLVTFEQNLNAIPVENESGSIHLISPIYIFSLLLLISFFWFPTPAKIVFCTVVGLVGLLIAVLWMFSGHPELRNNLNILWCSPLYLLYIPSLLKNKPSQLLLWILLITLGISIFIWVLRYQVFDISIIPILIILGAINLKELTKTAPVKVNTSTVLSSD